MSDYNRDLVLYLGRQKEMLWRALDILVRAVDGEGDKSIKDAIDHAKQALEKAGQY